MHQKSQSNVLRPRLYDMINPSWLGTAFALLLLPHLSLADISLPDIGNVPEDLVIPAVSEGPATAGKRVAQTTAGWEGTEVHHMLYLPTDWTPGKSWPVIVEYAGNGGFKGKYGDVCDGTVEDSRLGYGISGGQGCLWLCLPYVEDANGTKRNGIKWWGNVEETKRYCMTTVAEVCQNYGGDPARVILSGFSRGSIACNYIGLHDDEIAKLWRGFICHSHYDGVLVHWPYEDADRASALVRLRRLNGRPQFISHEMSVNDTVDWLHGTGIKGDWTFAPLPYRNHTDAWVLRDIPARQQVREWFHRVTGKK